MILESTVQVLGAFPAFAQTTICEEPSQARVSIAEAMQAGPIHRAFIDTLPPEWRNDPTVEIFSRALWLKEGWHPLTPHFHFDWNNGAEGPLVETIMVCLGDASLTEFILGPLEHPENRPQPGAMNHWHAQVEAGLSSGTLRSWHIEPETLILFDNRALHRARPAAKGGWRILLRAIRGLAGMNERNNDSGYGNSGYGNPGIFTTSRNGFIPVTDDEKSRYAPYHE